MAKESQAQKQQLESVTDFVQQLEMKEQVENDVQGVRECLETLRER